MTPGTGTSPGAWPTRVLAPLAITVGPCAWRASMLATNSSSAPAPAPGAAPYLRAHPSLIAALPDDGEDTLRAAAPAAAGLPVLLGVREPAFSRRLPALIESRMRAIGRDRVDLLALWVQDTAQLKGGSAMQTLFELRRNGRAGEIALAHEDVREVEWLALNTAARALVAPYGLHDQSARYRALAAAHEHGMACIAIAGSDPASIRFALGEADRALPVLAGPIPPDTTPMGPQEVESAWAEYRVSHAEPAPLTKGIPPD